jgi:alkanesulfonate monooxygenase SsuD/methylene tetrahydromethanopterin reductase-like flavin-dependent oxidoreductase (luciferase family)
MKAIWTDKAAEYHGALVDFGPMAAWPKPVQKPHPPVIVGGAFPYGARRAVRYGDGWMPIAGRPPHGDLAQAVPQFRKMAEEAGRDPASLPVTAYASGEELDQLKRYRDGGISRVIVSLDSAGADAVLPVLDRWTELMRKV